MLDNTSLLLGSAGSIFTFITSTIYYIVFKNNLDRGLRLFNGILWLWVGFIYSLTYLNLLKVCQDELSYSSYLRPMVFLVSIIPGIITVLDLKRHGVSFKSVIKEIKQTWRRS